MQELKRTPLFSAYEKWGAKTIDFGGWDLPVSFSGIMNEHEAVRNHAGLFDVSHMGEVIVEGKDSLAFLQYVMTNDIGKLEPNKAQYTFMCNEKGGTIDDLLVYLLEENRYMLVVNAANINKDISWLNEHKKGFEIDIIDKSDETALIAIQGPSSAAILQKAVKNCITELKPFRFLQHVTFHGLEGDAIVSRTGYTGEDGFEIYIHNHHARSLWDKLLEEGEKDGLTPAGLGARDSLRFEAGLPLYGQELSASISPIEAGLNFAVKINKGTDFIGKSALTVQVNEGTDRILIGAEILDKGIARTDYEVYNEKDEQIGIVTTGTKSPTLNKAIAFILIDKAYAEEGNIIYVQVRKKRLKAKVIRTPFYKKNK